MAAEGRTPIRLVGRLGSEDRVIYLRNIKGVYLSLRFFGPYGLRFAFGPGYTNRVTVRRGN